MRWNEFGKFLIVALAIIGGFCVYISPLANSIKQGLDLQGGTHVVLQAVDTPELKVDDDAVNLVSIHLCEILRHAEVHDVAGVVLDDQQDASASIGLLNAL